MAAKNDEAGRPEFGGVMAQLLQEKSNKLATTSETPSEDSPSKWWKGYIHQMAPYGGTPPEKIERMLEMAKVTESDKIYDLGCGDGRIVNMAAEKYGCSGVGIDLDRDFVAKAKENADRKGLSSRVTFKVEDAFAVDLSDATVITLFQNTSEFFTTLQHRLKTVLPKGTRVVNYAFPMDASWQAMEVDELNQVYLYVV